MNCYKLSIDCYAAFLQASVIPASEIAAAYTEYKSKYISNGTKLYSTLAAALAEAVDGDTLVLREYEITEEKYNSLRESHDIRELEKTRYAFEYGGHTVEIDVYPHEIGGDALDGYAVLEVEFERENEKIQLPDFIRIVRELTGTSEFSNKTLAKPVV